MANKSVKMVLDDELFERARQGAEQDGVSLEALFRLWVADYASGADGEGRTQRILAQLKARD
jgi:hypothetical protein